MGAAAVVAPGILAASAGVASAAEPTPPGESTATGEAAVPSVAQSNPSPSTKGFEYLYLNYSDFSARDTGGARIYDGSGNFHVVSGIILAAPLHLPRGASVRQLEAYTTTTSTATGFFARYPATGSVDESIFFSIPNSGGVAQTTTVSINYSVVATETLAMVLNMGNNTNTCRGVRIGYLPRSKVVPITPVRVWDSRNAGGAPGDGPAPPPGALQGPFNAGAVITLALGGYRTLPSGINGLACVLTMVTPTNGGFVKAYPGGSAEPLAVVGNFAAGAITNHYPVVATGTGGSNAGKLTISLGGGCTGVQIVLDIIGYIT